MFYILLLVIVIGLLMALPYAIYSDTQVKIARAKQKSKKCKDCGDC